MTIGIASPFNPNYFKDYIGDTGLPDINENATAVHTLVREFLQMGHMVIIYTSFPSSKFKNDVTFTSDLLMIHVLSRKFFVPKMGAFVRLYMGNRIAQAVERDIDKLDVLHAQWTYDYAYAVSKYQDRIPTFCTVRDWAPLISSMKMGIVDKIYWKCSLYVFRKVMKKKMHFIANSHYTENLIRTHYPQINPSVIFNPIKKEDIIIHRNIYSPTPIFISISQGIDERKNYTKLIEAFQLYRKKFPQGELWLVGGAFVESNTVVCVWRQKRLLENVKLFGRKNHSEVLSLLDQASVYVHPSLEETFGNTLIEAMARRVSVIGGEKSGAVPSVLGKGKYGLLCNVRDAHDICQKMAFFSNPRKREEFIERSTSYLQNTYSSDSIARQHISLYSLYLK